MAQAALFQRALDEEARASREYAEFMQSNPSPVGAIERWNAKVRAVNLRKRVTSAGVQLALLRLGLEVANADPSRLSDMVMEANIAAGRPGDRLKMIDLPKPAEPSAEPKSGTVWDLELARIKK